MNSIEKDLLSSFFTREEWRLNRCLAPGMNCTATAIRAHSLQNSRVLDLLVRNNHVKGLAHRIDKKTEPSILFDDVGRNRATTFTGFCSQHDIEIFRPIDMNAFSSTDSEHLFLVAYRAVARELHAVLEGAIKIQSGYENRIDLGIDSGEEPSLAGQLAVEHMMKAYQTYMYKCRFDEAYVSSQHDSVVHDVIKIRHEEPTVAVCSLFSIDGVSRNGDWVRVALNVLPINVNESIAVLSYLSEDTALARLSLSPILSSSSHYQKYLLSKLILNNCENFVVSPAYYEKWNVKKKDVVLDYFKRTLLTGNLEVENACLYLF